MIARGLVAVFSIALAACAARPNITADGADAKLMLKGYDPVAYFADNQAKKGDPAIKADHAGVTYRFATEPHRQAFAANPAKYVPAYGGFCANGAPYGILSGGEPTTWKIVDGRLLVFGGPKAMAYWELDPKVNLQRGDHYWETEMKDANPRWQSWKRWIFRVPHYKTGAELEAELQARKGASK